MSLLIFAYLLVGTYFAAVANVTDYEDQPRMELLARICTILVWPFVVNFNNDNDLY